jgi:hypothetical protein
MAGSCPPCCAGLPGSPPPTDRRRAKHAWRGPVPRQPSAAMPGFSAVAAARGRLVRVLDRLQPGSRKPAFQALMALAAPSAPHDTGWWTAVRGMPRRLPPPGLQIVQRRRRRFPDPQDHTHLRMDKRRRALRRLRRFPHPHDPGSPSRRQAPPSVDLGATRGGFGASAGVISCQPTPDNVRIVATSGGSRASPGRDEPGSSPWRQARQKRPRQCHPR